MGKVRAWAACGRCGRLTAITHIPACSWTPCASARPPAAQPPPPPLLLVPLAAGRCLLLLRALARHECCLLVACCRYWTSPSGRWWTPRLASLRLVSGSC